MSDPFGGLWSGIKSVGAGIHAGAAAAVGDKHTAKQMHQRAAREGQYFKNNTGAVGKAVSGAAQGAHSVGAGIIGDKATAASKGKAAVADLQAFKEDVQNFFQPGGWCTFSTADSANLIGGGGQAISIAELEQHFINKGYKVHAYNSRGGGGWMEEYKGYVESSEVLVQLRDKRYNDKIKWQADECTCAKFSPQDEGATLMERARCSKGCPMRKDGTLLFEHRLFALAEEAGVKVCRGCSNSEIYSQFP